jgi:hypothetical protein
MHISELVALTKQGALTGLFCVQHEGDKGLRGVVESALLSNSEVGEVIILSTNHSFVCDNLAAAPPIWVDDGPHQWVISTATARVHKAPGVMTISLSGESPLELE